MNLQNLDYKAAMFDFDGTVTEPGQYKPHPQIIEQLVLLSKKMPIAFCTGRQLESFVDHGLAALLEEIDEEEAHELLNNLYLIAENGSVGYQYDLEDGQFRQFYQAQWPSGFIPRKKLQEMLEERIQPYGSIYFNAHRVIVVMRTNLHKDENREIKDVYSLSDKLFDITTELLNEISEEVGMKFENFVHVGNSGIGVVICPANSDKDIGIKRFSEFLSSSRDLEFGNDVREIVVIGDRPMVGGNDHYFLNGKFGTAFTVGDLVEDKQWPLPVLDTTGERLLHYKGTSLILSELLER